jgi:hypothetical protein
MPILRELLTVLGFKAEDKELKAYDAKIVALKKNLFLLSAAAAAVATAIFGIAESAAKVGDELDKTKDLTGLTVQQLQELGGAAKLAGIGVEGLTTGMQLFSRQISQAAQGQQMSVRAFEMLGISIFGTNGQLKSNHQLLLEVADAFTHLRNQQLKTDLALQLFGRSGGRMINLLKNGAAGVREAEAEFSKFGFTLNEIQSKAAAKFQDRLTMVGFAVKGLKNAIGIALLPEVSRMVKIFLDWFVANKKIIQQNMIALFKNLATFVRIVADVFGAILSSVSQFINIFGGWNRVLKVTALLLGFLVSTKIIRGFLALGKAVLGLAGMFKKLALAEGIADALGALLPAIGIALFLLLDDIKNFFEGNDSLIGRFIKRFPELGKVVKGIAEVFKVVGEVVAFTFKWAFIEPLKLVWHLLKDIAHAIEKLFGRSKAGGGIKGIAGNLTAFAGLPLPTALIPSPAAIGGGGAANKTVTTHVNTNVNLSVPEGTPDQQKGFLQQTAEKTFDAVFSKHLKEAQARFPIVE